MADTVEAIDIKLITADPGVPKKVLEVYEYLKIYMDAQARTDWKKRWKTAWDAIENKMWTEDEEQQMRDLGQEPFVVNKIVKGVQASGAVITNQDPTMLFHPIGSSDLYVAELLKRGFDVVWAKNEGKDEVYDFSEDVDIGALGWLNVKLDKSRDVFGSIVFETEPSEDIYFDAKSRKRDFSDTHVIKAKLRTLQYIKDHYPDIKEDDLYFSPIQAGDASTSSGVEGVDNYAEADKAGTPDTTDPSVKSRQKNIWELEAWMMRTVIESWASKIVDGKPVHRKLEDKETLQKGELDWKRTVIKRDQRIIVGKKLVTDITNPLGEDSDNEPVMALVGMKAQRTRNAYPMSKTMYALDLNREKNKRRIQAIAAVTSELNAPIWSYEGVTWHSKKGANANPGTPGTWAKISKNTPGNPPLGRLAAGNSNIAALMSLEDRSDAEIDDVYDNPEIMQGKLPRGAEGQNFSGRLGLALQDVAGMKAGPGLRRLESALIRLTKGIVSLMLTKWPRYMWERLLEDEEKLKAPEGTKERDKQDAFAKERAGLEKDTGEPFEGEEDADIETIQKYKVAIDRIGPAGEDAPKDGGLSLIDIDIAITAGSSLPTNRMAKGALAIEYVNAGIFLPKHALDYIDDPNKDKIKADLEREAQAAAEAELTKRR